MTTSNMRSGPSFHQTWSRRLAAAVAVIALGAASAPGVAGPIVAGTYYQFGFGEIGSLATGCDPADPAGPICLVSAGTPADAPPWTFLAPASGATFTVIDAFLSGDQFQIFDAGNPGIFITSGPGSGGDCGDDPVACFADPAMSSGVFAFGPGTHSITIVPVLAPDESFGGSAYFLLTASPVVDVPEPGSLGLLAAGLGALWQLRRRRRMPQRSSNIVPAR